MTAVNRTTLYGYFQTGDKPTQSQFQDLIDSSLNLATTSAQSILSDVSALGNVDFRKNITVSGNAAFNGIVSANAINANNGSFASITLRGASNGNATLGVPVSAGTGVVFNLPTSNGLSTNVLQTDGSGNTSWGPPPASASGLTLLSTINAVGASSVVFSSTFITSTYNKYLVEMDSVFCSIAGQSIYLTGSTNNGGGYLSALYAWATCNLKNSTPSSDGSGSDAQLNLTSTSPLFTSTAGNLSGTISFAKPSASQPCMFHWSMDFGSGAQTSFFGAVGTGAMPGTTPINNIKLAASTGTLTGNFHLYGIQGT